MARSVLVVEDQEDIARLIRLHLQDLGCEVRLAMDGHAGLVEGRSGRYDLIVLDLMLPGVDGLEICRSLRGGSVYTPILMLTSKSSELDRVLGLELGADDYLVKPFSIIEFTARVKAIFRRVAALARSGASGGGSNVLMSGALTLDLDKRRVTLAGRDLDLTAKEYDLLVHFARNPGKVYSRTQLLDAVWGYSHSGYEHTVNSHINRLRAKLEADPANPAFILTVWGVGYRFVEQAAG